MARKIFVNLPVADLTKAKNFFASLGFTFNSQFTDDAAACMVISDDIYAMLLTHAKFKEFTPNPICDATKQNGSPHRSPTTRGGSRRGDRKSAGRWWQTLQRNQGPRLHAPGWIPRPDGDLTPLSFSYGHDEDFATGVAAAFGPHHNTVGRKDEP